MKRILVVDDSALVRMKCVKILSNNGYSVIEALNGQEALEKYREFKPDVVLMDIVMPKMHGINALHEIRRIDPVARIVMITSMGQKAMVTSALQEGASDFLVKPFREGRVLDTVTRMLNKTMMD